MMNIFTTLAFCAALSGEPSAHQKLECDQASSLYRKHLKDITLSKKDRDAIGRVAIAEARNQGDVGITAVIYTIINRLISKKWGGSITEVVNARHQFEPVHAVGGWHRLPKLSLAERTRINTIINLILDKRLPDPTHGALFFQNAAIVSKREKQGKVSKGLTHFGGSKPSAVIKDHSFYASAKGHHYEKAPRVRVKKQEKSIFVTTDNEHQPWDIYAHSKTNNENTHRWHVFDQD